MSVFGISIANHKAGRWGYSCGYRQWFKQIANFNKCVVVRLCSATWLLNHKTMQTSLTLETTAPNSEPPQSSQVSPGIQARKYRLANANHPKRLKAKTSSMSSYIRHQSLFRDSCHNHLVEAKLSKQGVHGNPLSATLVEIFINNTLYCGEAYSVVLR